MKGLSNTLPDKNIRDQDLPIDTENQQNQSSINTSAEFPDTNPAKRMSVTLPGDIADYLDKWAKAEHVSINELIRRSISTEIFLQKEIRAGSKLLLRRNDNQISEIIFR
ncbi:MULTISPECIES: ribbon-helix-helix domain-containing protein [unclassified Calothrix]|nr:CopG family transcriptional regulator [Calothrix sp. FACHB-1219]MBD2207842.1 ribbon-helix-helix protein, CopG family [Calothrix sp. FACHB-168]